MTQESKTPSPELERFVEQAQYICEMGTPRPCDIDELRRRGKAAFPYGSKHIAASLAPSIDPSPSSPSPRPSVSSARPRCPKCGSVWISVHYNEGFEDASRKSRALCRKSTCVYSGDVSEFFSSPPDSAGLAQKIAEALVPIDDKMYIARTDLKYCGWCDAEEIASLIQSMLEKP